MTQLSRSALSLGVACNGEDQKSLARAGGVQGDERADLGSCRAARTGLTPSQRALLERVTGASKRGQEYVGCDAEERAQLEALCCWIGLLMYRDAPDAGVRVYSRAAPLRRVVRIIGHLPPDPVLGFGPDQALLDCGHEEINWGSSLSRCTECLRLKQFETPYLNWEALL